MKKLYHFKLVLFVIVLLITFSAKAKSTANKAMFSAVAFFAPLKSNVFELSYTQSTAEKLFATDKTHTGFKYEYMQTIDIASDCMYLSRTSSALILAFQPIEPLLTFNNTIINNMETNRVQIDSGVPLFTKYI